MQSHEYLTYSSRNIESSPPNHMRVRVGVNNKLLLNQPYHLWLGMQYWVRWLTKGYVKPDSDVAEIGSGCGRIAHPLRNDWFTGTYLGIDIDKELLRWCSEHFPKDKFTFLASNHKSATYISDISSEAARFSFGETASKDFIFSRDGALSTPWRWIDDRDG